MAVFIDFETASELDLRKTGVYTYAEHPSTRVLCLCWDRDGIKGGEWRIGGIPPHEWRIGGIPPHDLLQLVRDGETVHAHNAEFEWVIWNWVFKRQLGINTPLQLNQLRCTMAQAMYHGLPASLDQLGEALDLPLSKRKDKDVGHRLMMRMNKPRAIKSDGTVTWWHEDDPQKFDQLVDYCHQDVTAEVAASRLIPPLPDPEHELWKLNCRMNAAGVGIDIRLVNQMENLSTDEKLDLTRELRGATNGELTSINNAVKMRDWFERNGLSVPDVSKATLASVKPDNPTVARVVELRQMAAKSSTAKLASIRHVLGDGDRVRGLIAYYGALRTGRYAGRLCQPHNYPRGVLKPDEFDEAIDKMSRGIRPRIKLFPVLDVISSCLRGTFIPRPGRGTHFVVGDFSQIEARMIAWLAGQKDILDVFASGQDVYIYAAKQVGSDNRQLGKVNTLALGFGMGAQKFMATAKTYGLDFTETEAVANVYDWRAANSNIVLLWSDLQEAVSDVLFCKSQKSVCVGKLEVGTASWNGTRHLWMRLPSGRKLWYYGARLIDGDIRYYGINSYTRKWEMESTYGGKLVENATQAAARDVMARALYKVDRLSRLLRPVLTVHDELVCETSSSTPSIEAKTLERFMSNRPNWCRDLPLAADVFVTERYRK